MNFTELIWWFFLKKNHKKNHKYRGVPTVSKLSFFPIPWEPHGLKLFFLFFFFRFSQFCTIFAAGNLFFFLQTVGTTRSTHSLIFFSPDRWLPTVLPELDLLWRMNWVFSCVTLLLLEGNITKRYYQNFVMMFFLGKY